MKFNHKWHTYNVICEVCRRKTPSNQIVRRWDGFLVCQDEGCFETRHESDRPRPPLKEDEALPFTNPEPQDTFNELTIDANAEPTTIPSGTFNESTL